MIEKIPIVIPNKERNVLNLLIVTDLTAKIIVSLRSLKNIIYVSRINLKTKDKKNHGQVTENTRNCNKAYNHNCKSIGDNKKISIFNRPNILCLAIIIIRK